ncbi:MAG: hypothetical protein KDC53_21640 [Saprospiraceae bacterium]|nr:hypothetical protein [Saprospiraceae bacterium]
MKTLLFFLILISSHVQVLADDFSIVRQRVIEELMKDLPEKSQISEILATLKEDGSFEGIDYTDLSRTAGFPHRQHTYNMVLLAKTYKDKHSTYYHTRELKDIIIKSLAYWVDHDFFGDNWHDNQISTPSNLVNLMLVMGDELPKELVEKAQPIIGRAHMKASGARPSGDRIVIAGILAKNLLFTGDHEGFNDIIRLIEGEVKFSTGSRGMQQDYSFHHRVDRVNNTTSYGYGKYANAFGEWSYYVANTQYAFSLEKINHLVDYYLDGICKQLVYGIYEDISVKNRSISNQSDFKPRDTIEIKKLLFSTDYRKAELEEILKLRKGEVKPSASFAKFFWQTEHFVFQRPDFYTTVRMYSTRNRNMEEPYNGPGKTTHHRADGTNYLQLKGDEYHDIWPVYDWQKISGTTIVQKEKLHGIENIQVDGVTDFVGAITDGLYGAVAFDFVSPHDLVAAKKSWFFFDKEYVCLGADIHLKFNKPVVTTIDQVLMRSDISIMQDNQMNLLPRGSHDLENIKAIYHDGVGYIFPQPTKIHISNQEQKGSWADITDRKNVSEEILSKDVFSAWFDHGNHPSDASYAYIVIPVTTKDDLAKNCSDNRSIDVVVNTAQQQAVFNHTSQIGQAVFYQAGSLKFMDDFKVEMESQGMVMVQFENNRIKTLSVADPSRKLKKLMLTISGNYSVSGENFSTSVQGDETTFIIDLPQGVYVGKSVDIKI